MTDIHKTPWGTPRVIETFTFPGTRHPIQVLAFDGEPWLCWFIALEAVKAVDLGNASLATKSVPTEMLRLIDRRSISNLQSPHLSSGNAQLILVSETGLYGMMFRSRKPAAKAFQAWVLGVVIPAVRQHGLPTAVEPLPEFQIPQNYAAALRAHADEVERRERAERGLAAQAITIQSHEGLTRVFSHMMSTEGTFSVAESAKALRRDPRIDTGETRLFTFLERHKLIFRRGRKRAWEAYQTAIDKKLLEMAVSEYKDSAGTVHKKMQIRVTLKGQLWLWGLYTGRIGEVPPPAVLELPQ